MKTQTDILKQIVIIKADSRWPKTKKQIATVFENAPLALIQVHMAAKVEALHWVLESTKYKGHNEVA